MSALHRGGQSREPPTPGETPMSQTHAVLSFLCDAQRDMRYYFLSKSQTFLPREQSRILKLDSHLTVSRLRLRPHSEHKQAISDPPILLRIPSTTKLSLIPNEHLFSSSSRAPVGAHEKQNTTPSMVKCIIRGHTASRNAVPGYQACGPRGTSFHSEGEPFGFRTH